MKLATEERPAVRLDPDDLGVESLFVEELETARLDITEGPGCQVNVNCTNDCMTNGFSYPCWCRPPVLREGGGGAE